MAIMWKVCLIALVAIMALGLTVDSASVSKREVQTETVSETEVSSVTTVTPTPTVPITTKAPKICDPTFNCGWAVYTGFTRHINYFMKNACECPEGEHCVRVDDDQMISAYIYKCRAKRPTVPPSQNDEE